MATTTQRHALAVLHRLATAVAHAESLEQIYDLAITALRSALGADRSAVLIRDASGTMQFEAWWGLSATFREAVSCHLPWPADDGAPAPLVVPDVQTSEAVAPRRAALVAEGIGSLAFIPVLYVVITSLRERLRRPGHTRRMPPQPAAGSTRL